MKSEGELLLRLEIKNRESVRGFFKPSINYLFSLMEIFSRSLHCFSVNDYLEQITERINRKFEDKWSAQEWRL